MTSRDASAMHHNHIADATAAAGDASAMHHNHIAEASAAAGDASAMHQAASQWQPGDRLHERRPRGAGAGEQHVRPMFELMDMVDEHVGTTMTTSTRWCAICDVGWSGSDNDVYRCWCCGGPSMRGHEAFRQLFERINKLYYLDGTE